MNFFLKSKLSSARQGDESEPLDRIQPHGADSLWHQRNADFDISVCDNKDAYNIYNRWTHRQVSSCFFPAIRKNSLKYSKVVSPDELMGSYSTSVPEPWHCPAGHHFVGNHGKTGECIANSTGTCWWCFHFGKWNRQGLVHASTLMARYFLWRLSGAWRFLYSFLWYFCG